SVSTLINICRIGLRLTSYRKQSFQLLSSLFVARTGRYISMAKRPRSPYCRDAGAHKNDEDHVVPNEACRALRHTSFPLLGSTPRALKPLKVITFGAIA